MKNIYYKVGKKKLEKSTGQTRIQKKNLKLKNGFQTTIRNQDQDSQLVNWMNRGKISPILTEKSFITLFGLWSWTTKKWKTRQ